MTTPPLALAAGLACALAWRAPSRGWRVIAATLTGLLAVNVGRPWLRPWLTLDLAAFAFWYALTAWGASAALARADSRWRRMAPAALALALACLAASPLAVRSGYVAELPRAAFALALAAELLAFVRFIARGEKPDDAQRVALALIASSVADLAGPWLAGDASRDWHVGHIPAVITWIAVSAWEGRCLIRARKDRG